METRRTLLFSSLGASLAAMAAARGADAVFPHLNDDSPKATLIKGAPNVLDFGDGLKVRCDKSAFLTLFEGKTFWLTLGAGRATYIERAQGEAVLYALGAMKLLLMTLAFTPERLVNVDGGWKLKQQNINNYVLGDIQLPGKPYWPLNDADLDLNSPYFAGPIGGGGGAGTGPSQGNGPQPPGAPSIGSDLNKANAFTSYIVMKRDVSLEYVRARAQVLLR